MAEEVAVVEDLSTEEENISNDAVNTGVVPDTQNAAAVEEVEEVDEVFAVDGSIAVVEDPIEEEPIVLDEVESSLLDIRSDVLNLSDTVEIIGELDEIGELDQEGTLDLNTGGLSVIISREIDDRRYVLNSRLCSIINSVSTFYSCLVYPIDDFTEMPSYIRKGIQADKFDETGINGDFVVLRFDEYVKYLKGLGEYSNPDRAPLDMVMFLEGEYLFSFAQKNRRAFDLETIITLGGDIINVGVINNHALSLFRAMIEPFFPEKHFQYINVNANFEDYFCKFSSIDIFIYFGFELPQNTKSALNGCAHNIVPLRVPDFILDTIISRNNILSSADVSLYYSYVSLYNFVNIYLDVSRIGGISESAAATSAINRVKDTDLELIDEEAQEEDDSLIDSDVTDILVATDSDEVPTLANDQAPDDYPFIDQPVQDTAEAVETVLIPQEEGLVVLSEDDLDRSLGRAPGINTDFSARLGGGEDNFTSDAVSESSLVGLVNIQTFGIRYVLLASRYTTQNNVFRVFEGVVRNFYDMRDNFIFPDMRRFTVNDLLDGSGVSYNFVYHPALYKYSRDLLAIKSEKSTEQIEAITYFTANLSTDTSPYFYGPAAPDTVQLLQIQNALRELNRKRTELVAVKLFIDDIERIDIVLNAIKNGEEVQESILRSTGIVSSQLLGVFGSEEEDIPAEVVIDSDIISDDAPDTVEAVSAEGDVVSEEEDIPAEVVIDSDIISDDAPDIVEAVSAEGDVVSEEEDIPAEVVIDSDIISDDVPDTVEAVSAEGDIASEEEAFVNDDSEVPFDDELVEEVVTSIDDIDSSSVDNNEQ